MADGGVAVLEVHIPSVGPEAEGPDRTLEKGHMVFRVEIFYNGRRHTIQRRYSEFHALHKRGVLYLNQEIPKELLEFLKLRHFPSDTKASSLDSLGEFLPGNSSCQLHHRPVLNFNKDPYVDPPSSESLPNTVVNGVLQGLYGFGLCPAKPQRLSPAMRGRRPDRDCEEHGTCACCRSERLPA
ncbi:sorting nexin-22 isoform X2 [Ornithorhynchus anatinus]|uniref:sorting nexin-22 isoform X2 n=1 Tax=Ornithorhynchus anatinus TaxID=9258 RepID=UPI0010A9040C|nr:sorting nexin-22 isoform X2 [Ornithorhynchus anatinus]